MRKEQRKFGIATFVIEGEAAVEDTSEFNRAAGQAKGRFRLPAVFSSLHHRNYRLLWFGNLVSVSGDWMDQIAFSWLVYSMTHSTVALALVNVCRAGPILVFTLIGGLVRVRSAENPRDGVRA